MCAKTILTPGEREEFEMELIEQFQIYFKFNYTGDKAALIEIYKDSRHIDKTGLWDTIGRAVNITGEKAYKYYTNTWSRIQQPKWPKDAKNHFKIELVERVKSDFDRTLDVHEERTEMLKSFVEEEHIKERYAEYHFDSLYFYLYNVISSTMGKLGADLHDLNSLYADEDNISGQRKSRRAKRDETSFSMPSEEKEDLPPNQEPEYDIQLESPEQASDHFHIVAAPLVDFEPCIIKDQISDIETDHELIFDKTAETPLTRITESLEEEHLEIQKQTDFVENIRDIACGSSCGGESIDTQSSAMLEVVKNILGSTDLCTADFARLFNNPPPEIPAPTLDFDAPAFLSL